MGVVFFGSGPVAARCLELLVKHTKVEAVVTKPRPPHHRGDVPVVTTAEHLGLPLHLARNKKELSALIGGASFESNIAVLIDFGIIVAQDVIDAFPLGIINSHFSILPEWRGADPISFSILSGQESTGVSLMLLVEAMDEGPLLAFDEFKLAQDVTEPELTTQLILLSDDLLKKHLSLYLQNQTTYPQTVTKRTVSYSRKLTKGDGTIDWNEPAEQIEREIRAYIEWPKSRTTIAGKDVIIKKVTVACKSLQPGVIETHDKSLLIGCSKDALRIESLQPAGKKEMTAEGFLAGHKHLLL